MYAFMQFMYGQTPLAHAWFPPPAAAGSAGSRGPCSHHLGLAQISKAPLNGYLCNQDASRGTVINCILEPAERNDLHQFSRLLYIV